MERKGQAELGRKYTVGIQTFSELREKGYVHVDKTEQICRLANGRHSRLIKRLYKQTGGQVAPLIDEYDAPLLDVVHEEENLPELRQVTRDFLTIKGCSPVSEFYWLGLPNKEVRIGLMRSLLQDYAGRFSLTGLPGVKEGVSFDSEERAISDWKTETMS